MGHQMLKRFKLFACIVYENAGNRNSVYHKYANTNNFQKFRNKHIIEFFTLNLINVCSKNENKNEKEEWSRGGRGGEGEVSKIDKW